MLVPLASKDNRCEPLGIRLIEHPTDTMRRIITAARGNSPAQAAGRVNADFETVHTQGWRKHGIEKASQLGDVAVAVCSHDLNIRTRRSHRDPVSADGEFTHEHPGQHTGALDKWLELVDADTRTYETNCSRLLWLTHVYSRFLPRGGRKTKASKAHG